MNKCLNCGIDNSGESKFCFNCGAKILSPEETERIIKERERQYNEASELKKEELIKRQCNSSLVIALIGLILDFIYGIGCIFAAIGLILSLKGYIISRKQIFLWPVFLSAAGFLFGVFYLFLMIVV